MAINVYSREVRLESKCAENRFSGSIAMLFKIWVAFCLELFQYNCSFNKVDEGRTHWINRPVSFQKVRNTVHVHEMVLRPIYLVFEALQFALRVLVQLEKKYSYIEFPILCCRLSFIFFRFLILKFLPALFEYYAWNGPYACKIYFFMWHRQILRYTHFPPTIWTP